MGKKLQGRGKVLSKPVADAEFALLRYQTDPHVLFNNFNSLYAISLHKPELLAVSVRMLRDNLYYIFRDSQMQKTLLKREVEVIENFIGLERLRYGDRLNAHLQLDGKPRSLRITPLILYAFVETILLKGAAENPFESRIQLKLVIKKELLCFTGEVSGEFIQGSKSEQETYFLPHILRLEETCRDLYQLKLRNRPESWGFELILFFGDGS